MRLATLLLAALSLQAQVTVAMQYLPDTGQTRHFAAGDDSDYNTRAPKLVTNADGTVTDHVTGLMWQLTDGGEMKWDRARDYCTSLNLAGFSDWRVPANRELFTIMNHNNAPPALDNTIFGRPQAEYWWASELQAGDPAKAWVVNAGGGSGPHAMSETISAGGTKRYHVRCVRQDIQPWSVDTAFTTVGDGTVIDNRTGLMWQEAEADSQMTWPEALDYALHLDFAGYQDWRLPNIKEIQSLHDESVTRPAISTMYFPTAKAALYWSSTTWINPQDERAWTIDFTLGIVSYNKKTDRLRVRLVRAGIEDPTPVE